MEDNYYDPKTWNDDYPDGYNYNYTQQGDYPA